MGKQTVTEIVTFLKESGFRCQRGYPGDRMPDIQAPAVAVNIHSQDDHSVCMAVWVMGRVDRDAAACEDLALRIADLLRTRGASCTQDPVHHDGRADRFAVRILALWKDDPPECPYAVFLNGVRLRQIKSCSCRQDREFTPLPASGSSHVPEVPGIKGSWILTLDELLPGSAKEAEPDAEPFTVLIKRGTGEELYQTCYWKSVLREHTGQGLHLIRSASAGTRSVKNNG